MNMGSLVTRNALHWPAGLARVCGDQRLTDRQLNNEVNRLANALLALGVNKGDRIATLLPACPELMEVQLGRGQDRRCPRATRTRPERGQRPRAPAEARASLVVGSTATADAIAAVKPVLPIAHDRYLLTDAVLTGFRDFHGSKRQPPLRSRRENPPGTATPSSPRHRAYLFGR